MNFPKIIKRVKIRLFDQSGANKILDITNDTGNDGLFKWTIPNNVLPGPYVIRVKTLDNQESDDSNVFFIRDAPGTSGSIRVIAPTSMWSFTAGGNMTIKWSTSGLTGKGLVIRLISAENPFIVIIKDNHPYNASPLLWKIPDDMESGKYFIDIVKGNVNGKSGNFTINRKTSTINVTSPGGGVTRLKGKICNIAWFSSNINENEVLIRLIPGSGHLPQNLSIITDMAYNKDGKNNYSWTIPAQVPDGKYSISVQKRDGSVKGGSGEFAIAGKRGDIISSSG